jgi:pilus assembly protein CpaC
LGVTSVEYREFGTTVDFVPTVLGNGRIKLEVRPQVTEIDPSLRDPVTGTPGFRSRRVDTGVELGAGQTLALAGLIQNRVDAENLGLPFFADMPWIGAMFRSVQETVNEVELLVLVTPELVAHLDIYGRGYIEVPACCPDGSCPQCHGGGAYGPVGPTGHAPIYEEVVPPSAAPAGATGAAYRKPASTSRAAEPNTAQSLPQHRPLPSGSDNSYIPNARNNPTSQPSQKPTNSPPPGPALIGPIGYDVLN